MSLLLQGAGSGVAASVIAALNPTAWYDMSALGLSDGVACSSAPNLGTVGGSLAQATGSKQPLAKTGANGINGLSVLLGDGVDDIMSQTFALTSPATWFVVAQYASAFVAGDVISDGIGDTGFNLLTRQGSTTVGIIGGGPLYSGTTTPLAAHVYTAVFGTVGSAVRTELWFDGTKPIDLLVNMQDAGGCTLFAHLPSSGIASSFGNVKIGEVVVFDTPPSLADGNAVRAALKTKWGTP